VNQQKAVAKDRPGRQNGWRSDPFDEVSTMIRIGFAGLLAVGMSTTLASGGPPSQATQLPPPRFSEQLAAPQPPVVIDAPRPIGPRDFAKSFVPAPGKYDVLFLHPVNGKPVSVLFQLPDGMPRKVQYVGHFLVFDYGRHKVDIHFQAGGKVTVAQR
jgi:hypothetical protein